ncbi:MAG: hypothetical protein PGMFKBFP_02198 [Anaerolineales bacterium]|nr:hypothetical protein [Anaerolineales bacterium]
MLLARLEVLADGQNVHAPTALVAHHGFDLVHRLAETDHDARLGQRLGVETFRVRERRRGPFVVVLRLDGFEQARHRLHVVVQNFGTRVHHDLQRFHAPFEVGDQHLDGAARQQLADAADDHGEDRRAAVAAFVAVDRGDHRVLQIHGLDGLRHAFGLAPIEQAGASVFDVAESAGARAHVAEHQKRGGAAAPTFAHVGTHGFFANRVQFFRAHQRLQAFVVFARRGAYLDPFRAAQRTRFRLDGDPVSCRGGNCH